MGFRNRAVGRGGAYPERDRIDFGSLLVPVYDGIEIEVKVAEGVGVWITVRRGDSTIELMAFAAPKTSGLWDEVRQEFADEVANAGGSSEEAQGPFGVELHARLHPGGEGRRGQLEPVRFLGVGRLPLVPARHDPRPGGGPPGACCAA